MTSHTSRTLLLNVAAFALVIGLGTSYLAFSVYHFNPGARTTSITMEVSDTSTALAGTGVFLNGIRIGRVTAVTPTPAGARISVAYPSTERIPHSSQVSIGQQSALGEPFIDFRPRSSTGPWFRSGDSVAPGQIAQKQSIPEIFATIKGVTTALSAGPLEGLLATLADALDGTTGSLNNIAIGTQMVSSLFQDHTEQLEKMFRGTQQYTAELGPVLDSFPTLSAGLQQFLKAVHRTDDALAPLVQSNAFENLRNTIDPFIARLNPYLKDILPNVLDAVGPLLPIATAVNETLPQINLSDLLTRLLGVVGSDGAARISLQLPHAPG